MGNTFSRRDPYERDLPRTRRLRRAHLEGQHQAEGAGYSDYDMACKAVEGLKDLNLNPPDRVGTVLCQSPQEQAAIYYAIEKWMPAYLCYWPTQQDQHDYYEWEAEKVRRREEEDRQLREYYKKAEHGGRRLNEFLANKKEEEAKRNDAAETRAAEEAEKRARKHDGEDVTDLPQRLYEYRENDKREEAARKLARRQEYERTRMQEAVEDDAGEESSRQGERRVRPVRSMMAEICTVEEDIIAEPSSSSAQQKHLRPVRSMTR